MYETAEAHALLARTPELLRAWLVGLPGGWTTCDEGAGTFTPHDVVAHLINAERNLWVTRARLFFEADGQFKAFDRVDYIEEARGRPLAELVDEFARLRGESLKAVAQLVTTRDLARTAVHPEFGTVELGQLLSTWVVHDLTHIVQIARVMANRYRADVGPWAQYLGVLGDRQPAAEP